MPVPISRMNTENKNEQTVKCKILLFFIRFRPFHRSQQHRRNTKNKDKAVFILKEPQN